MTPKCPDCGYDQDCCICLSKAFLIDKRIDELEQQLAEREKQIVMLQGTVEHILEYWNGHSNETAMHDALCHIEDTCIKALAATQDLLGLILCDANPFAYVAEGYHDGEIFAKQLYWTIEEAQETCGVFIKHYEQCRVIPLYTVLPSLPSTDLLDKRDQKRDAALLRSLLGTVSTDRDIIYSLISRRESGEWKPELEVK